VARDPAESGIRELEVPCTRRRESRYSDTRFPDGAKDIVEDRCQKETLVGRRRQVASAYRELGGS
jgi:hypothetical protein